MISIIVPVRVSDALFNGLERIEDILVTVPASDFEVVVVDYGSPEPARSQLVELVGRYTNGKLVRVDNELEPFSAGNARNIGAQHATSNVIMFNDVDCICSPSMYSKIAREARVRNISQNAYEFFSVPIAFLTYEGVEEYVGLRSSDAEIVDDIFIDYIVSGNKHLVDFVAYTGSTVVVNRNHYLSLGGSNPEFHGHGAEDYEIKHRLAAYNSIAKRPLDYYLNTKSGQVSEYVGFRAYFALYGIEVLYRGICMVHMWHPRREVAGRAAASASAYNQTSRNFALLKNLMKRFDEAGFQPVPLQDLSRSERALILCKPNSIALESMRHALPLNGAYEIIDEDAFDDAKTLIESVRRHGFTRVGFLNPYGNEHRLALYRGIRREKIPFWVFDRGALPHSWFFDPGGFNADSATYDSSQWDHALSDSQKATVHQYVKKLKQSGAALEKSSAPRAPKFWLDRFGVGHRKVLFVPLQRPSDTVTRYFNANVGPYENFYLWVAAIAAQLDPSEWVVVCKKHPLEVARPEIPGVIFAPNDAHVNDMVEIADAVLLLNSGVGVLALAFGKPVITCGDAFYAHPGLAVRASSPDEAARLVQDAKTDQEAVERFIFHLISRVYSFGESSYSEREQPDGSKFTAVQKILFSSIRGLGEPVTLGVPRKPVPFDSILFATYGGAGTQARARSSQLLVRSSENAKKVEPGTGKKVETDAGVNELLHQAYIAYQRGNFSAAADKFKSASARDPGSVHIMRCEAEARLRSGDRVAAAACLKRAQKRLPKNKRIRIRLLGAKYPLLLKWSEQAAFEVPMVRPRTPNHDDQTTSDWRI